MKIIFGLIMLPLMLWVVTANAYVSSVDYRNQQFNQRYNNKQFDNRTNGFNQKQYRYPTKQYRNGYRPHNGYRAQPNQYRGHQYRHPPRTSPNRGYRGGAPGGGYRH